MTVNRKALAHQILVPRRRPGIDGAVLNGHQAGHFGLPGMRERAERIGGRFEVWSEIGMGTEIALTIPAAAVYATPTPRRHFWPLLGRTQS